MDDKSEYKVQGIVGDKKVNLRVRKISEKQRLIGIFAIFIIAVLFLYFVVTHIAFTLFIVSLPLMLVSLIVSLFGIVKNRNRTLQYISLGILLVSFILIVIVHLLPVIIIGFALLVISLITARIYRHKQFPLR